MSRASPQKKQFCSLSFLVLKQIIIRAQDIFIVTRAWLDLNVSPFKLALPTRLKSEPRFANTWIIFKFLMAGSDQNELITVSESCKNQYRDCNRNCL